jgi:hypothetical protein
MLGEAAPSELMNNIIWFTNNLDPNGNTDLEPNVIWPQWDPQNPKALIFQDGLLAPRLIGDDNYRTAAMEFMRNISLINPI